MSRSDRSSHRVDRREFLGAAGATLALSATALPRWLEAAPSLVPVSQTMTHGTWGEWDVDDMWQPLPRPTTSIGLGRRVRALDLEIADVDRQFGG